MIQNMIAVFAPLVSAGVWVCAFHLSAIRKLLEKNAGER